MHQPRECPEPAHWVLPGGTVTHWVAYLIDHASGRKLQLNKISASDGCDLESSLKKVLNIKMLNSVWSQSL